MKLAYMITILVFGFGWAAAHADEFYVECTDRSCIDFGWVKTNLDTFEETTRVCAPGGCHLNGWNTFLPGGAQLITTCDGNGCFVDGYTERNSQGRITKKVKCEQGGCHYQGSIQVNIEDREMQRETCTNDNCNDNGWTTTLPNGTPVSETVCLTLNPRSCFSDGYITVEH